MTKEDTITLTRDEEITRRRRRAAIFAGVASVICFVMLTAALLLSWSSLIATVLLFLFLLALFHFVYFWFDSITQRTVKMIDYPYLLIGALGVFLAFGDAARDREQLYSDLGALVIPSTATDLKAYVAEELDSFCSEGFQPPFFCQISREILSFLNLPFMQEELKKKVVEIQNELSEHAWSDAFQAMIFDLHHPLEGLGGFLDSHLKPFSPQAAAHDDPNLSEFGDVSLIAEIISRSRDHKHSINGIVSRCRLAGNRNQIW